jgi:predicted DNA-binding protein YlxM (UPF0122 family)
MEIVDVIRMYNEEGKSLREIGEHYGISKSTIQRRLIDAGYKYDKIEGKYLCIVTNEEEIEEQLINDSEYVAFRLKDGTNNFEQHKTRNINRTYNISEEIDKALKLKAILEGKTVIEVMRDILRNGIEKKYFDMAGGKNE